MKARLPKGYGRPDPNAMMRQVQKMQDEIRAKQEELEAKEYTGTASGEMVTVTMTGKHEITTVKMDEELKDSYPSGNVLKTDILLNVIAYADAENEILDASACEEYSKVTTDDTYQLPGVEVKAEAEDGIIDLGGKSYAVSDDVSIFLPSPRARRSRLAL